VCVSIGRGRSIRDSLLLSLYSSRSLSLDNAGQTANVRRQRSLQQKRQCARKRPEDTEAARGQVPGGALVDRSVRFRRLRLSGVRDYPIREDGLVIMR